MGNELAKAIKNKTDSQWRMNSGEQSPSSQESPTGTIVFKDPSVYTKPIVAGKNVTFGTEGDAQTINAVMNLLAGSNITVSVPDENGQVTITGTIGGKNIDVNVENLIDGHVVTYDLVTDKFILSPVASSYELPQANETTLGGIKAKEKTTETSEIAIDPATGKLYGPSAGVSENGLPAGGTIGQILTKIDGTDYNTQWVKPIKSIAFYLDDNLTVDTNCISIIVPQAMTITEIRAVVSTAPTGSDIIFDINKNGTTIYTIQSNRPTISASNTTATFTDPDVTSLILGDILSIDVDQIGSVIAGANLSVIIICEV